MAQDQLRKPQSAGGSLGCSPAHRDSHVPHAASSSAGLSCDRPTVTSQRAAHALAAQTSVNHLNSYKSCARPGNGRTSLLVGAGRSSETLADEILKGHLVGLEACRVHVGKVAADCVDRL